MSISTNLTTGITLKNISYIGVFFASASYLQITPISIGVLSFLIIIDVITGVFKSGTINGWTSIKSSVAERGIIAKMLIILIPIVVALAGKGVGISLGELARSVINILILSESYSVMGNIYSIRTGIIQDEFDGVAYVLSNIKTLLKKVIVEDPPKSI